MKYRAILNDPGNSNQERPVQIHSNSLKDIQTWAYGSTEGGMERPRGVLPSAVSETAIVTVYAIEERMVAMYTKKGKPA
jgi:hypothetical protein